MLQKSSMFEITLVAEDHEPSIGIVNKPLIGSGCLTKPSTHLDTSPKSEPALELHSRAATSVEAHHCVSSPNTGINSIGKREKTLSNLD